MTTAAPVKKGKNICMAFLPTGDFETVYSDTITADPAVTVAEVKRFSEVEFEEGYWVARRPDGQEICRHKLRSECLKQEANLAADYIHHKRERTHTTNT